MAPTAPPSGPQNTPPVAAGGPMGAFSEIGVTGLRIFTGYLDEEYIQELRGERGRKTYRQMSDNDPTIAAILNAIGLLLRAVRWTAEPAQDGGAQAEAEAEFAESLFTDMSHTFEDFIGEVVTFLIWGFSYFEIVLKRRVGPDTDDPTQRSNFADGRIGIRKLAPRAQETQMRWEMQPDGGIAGMWQIPPQGGGTVLIPIERALLFRTMSRKNSPEGVSILRSAFRPWKLLTRIQEYEAIGIERELAGLPVVRIPARYFSSKNPVDQEFLSAAQKLARDLKFNSQGGIVITSDLQTNPDGTLTTTPQVSIDLIKSAGSRSIDTGGVKQGYITDIARSVLADFLILGGASKGAYNLAESKTNLFYKALESFAGQIASVLNRYLMPRIFNANAIPLALMPTMKPGRLMPLDPAALGTFLGQLATAGAPVFPNQELLNFLFEEANLPEVSDEALAEQETQQQQQLEAKAQQAAALVQGGGGDGQEVGKFDESKHPRGHGGEFSASGGLVAGIERAAFPAHIQALKLPPAWTDVRINPDPGADLLAIGKDKKGRSQYVYSAKFQGDQAAQKFKPHRRTGK
jgi:hypothetical protein